MEHHEISADDLLLFAAIAAEGRLAAAGTRLAIPPATVSRRLAALEARLGQILVVRTTRQLRLTEFGIELARYCERIADEVRAATDFARSQRIEPRGTLRVSLPADVVEHMLSTTIATFTARYPGIELVLDLTPRIVDLIGEQFDLAIRMGPLKDDRSLVARRLWSHAFGIYASPIYIATRGQPATPDDLPKHVAIHMARADETVLPWALRNAGDTRVVSVPGQIRVNSPTAVRALLIDGAGLGLLPVRHARDALAQGQLVRVLPQWQPPEVSAYAVMPQRRHLSPKTRLFIEHVVGCVGMTPSHDGSA